MSAGTGLTSSAGLAVLLDGFVALVQEIEHLAGVELGAATSQSCTWAGQRR